MAFHFLCIAIVPVFTTFDSVTLLAGTNSNVHSWVLRNYTVSGSSSLVDGSQQLSTITYHRGSHWWIVVNSCQLLRNNEYNFDGIQFRHIRTYAYCQNLGHFSSQMVIFHINKHQKLCKCMEREQRR